MENFEEYIIEGVEVFNTGKYSCAITADGWTLLLPKVVPFIPKMGDKARYYGKGIGFLVTGIEINGIKFR